MSYKSLSIININDAYKSKDIISKFYCRLLLIEYCAEVWTSYSRKYIDMITTIQSKATRKTCGCENLNYWMKLKKIGDVFYGKELS